MIVILFEIVRYITVTVETVMIVILFEIVRYIAVTDEICYDCDLFEIESLHNCYRLDLLQLWSLRLFVTYLLQMRFVMIMILFEIVRYIAVTDEICYNYYLVWDWIVSYAVTDGICNDCNLVRYIAGTDEICYDYDLVWDCSLHSCPTKSATAFQHNWTTVNGTLHDKTVLICTSSNWQGHKLLVLT